ncbi:hypothetical protein ACFY8P_08325 [Streptomyces sp. NPDC012693]|uniref:hypothetical protein n=1 Tax=Streptomyces sp. NPDC012693 TaxID=3364844 RepID=UPI0036AEBC13
MTRGEQQRTALVLGAGGLVGAAWEAGVLWGLAEAGTALSTADLVVGSSAGAVVGSGAADSGRTVAQAPPPAAPAPPGTMST